MAVDLAHRRGDGEAAERGASGEPEALSRSSGEDVDVGDGGVAALRRWPCSTWLSLGLWTHGGRRRGSAQVGEAGGSAGGFRGWRVRTANVGLPTRMALGRGTMVFFPRVSTHRRACWKLDEGAWTAVGQGACGLAR